MLKQAAEKLRDVIPGRAERREPGIQNAGIPAFLDSGPPLRGDPE
jgi:hypothetical protein